jgi:Tfp pilus assembly protein PilX
MRRYEVFKDSGASLATGLTVWLMLALFAMQEIGSQRNYVIKERTRTRNA